MYKSCYNVTATPHSGLQTHTPSKERRNNREQHATRTDETAVMTAKQVVRKEEDERGGRSGRREKGGEKGGDGEKGRMRGMTGRRGTRGARGMREMRGMRGIVLI